MKKLLALALCFALVGGLTVNHLWRWWQHPHPGQQSVTLTIDGGSSLQSVAVTLENLGTLRYPVLWQLVARAKGLDNQIKSGEYQLGSDLSPSRMLEVLVAGKVVQYSVTLPEGITLADAIGILQARNELTHSLAGASDDRLLALVSPHGSAEGQFFPDTYHFVRGDSDYSVLVQANQRMTAVLGEVWAEGASHLPYRSPYDLLIMASVVEKETGLAAERERIAGVFVRRLQKRMRLQTDPTVIYGLGAGFDGNLRRRHLEDSGNPYNTYRHHGLPPTPIALPGLAALRAALYPAEGSELYFVARGDGSHAFSDTLEQHQKAVRNYQLKRASNYRSAPKKSDTRQ
jgi:UPF0755 protein